MTDRYGPVAHYLVRANLVEERIAELRDRLFGGEFEPMDPFGEELTQALKRARIDPEDAAVVWEEEDHCTPPLRMERDAVLDDYFVDLEVEEVSAGEGWERIRNLPRLWRDDVDPPT